MNVDTRILRIRLDGSIIAAVPAPFDAAGHYRPDDQIAMVRQYARSALDGVAVWTPTGRGERLDPELRGAILRRWRKGLNRRQFIIAGVGRPRTADDEPEEDITDENYIERAVETARQARKLGAQGIIAYPPLKFRARPERDVLVLGYHQALSTTASAMIPTITGESNGGMEYDLDLLAKLLELPTAAGILIDARGSGRNFRAIAEPIRERFGEVPIVNGEEGIGGDACDSGAGSVINTLAAAAPDLMARAMQARRDGDAEQSARLAETAERLTSALFAPPEEGFIRRLLLSLARSGAIGAAGTFDPWGPEVDGSGQEDPTLALEGVENE